MLGVKKILLYYTSGSEVWEWGGDRLFPSTIYKKWGQ